MSNVLILSAGRRVGLVNCFKDYASKIGIGVFAADLNPVLSSACAVSDSALQLPPFDDELFSDALISACDEYSISLIIPTIDTGLLMLSLLSNELHEHGVEIAICDRSLINDFSDKRKTSIFFQKHEIGTPEIYDKNELRFPCFCKPYDGSLSVGAFKIEDSLQVSVDALENPKNMFMEYVSPFEYHEYTVDLYYCREGQLKCVVPRRRLEIRGGEVSKGLTGNDIIVNYINEKIQKLPGAKGVLTLQLFYRPEDGKILAIEINPRFGGGYPLTDASGAKYAKWLIEEYVEGKEIDTFNDWRRDLLMLRYDEQVLIDGFIDRP